MADIDASQLHPALRALLFGQDPSIALQPSSTSMPLGAQPRQGANPTAPTEAPGVSTPVNQAPTNYDSVIQQIMGNYLQQGKQQQDAAEQKLGIGKYEQGHPVRAIRHFLENLAGVGFELHGRSAPWLNQRMEVESPDYPLNVAQQLMGMQHGAIQDVMLPEQIKRMLAQTQGIQAGTAEKGAQTNLINTRATDMPAMDAAKITHMQTQDMTSQQRVQLENAETSSSSIYVPGKK